MKEDKRKEERAITLIALLITIIVLIILAAVAIKIAVDTGIVNLAKNSTEKYAAGQVEESKGMQNTYEMLESAAEKIARANGESGNGDVVQIDKSEYEGMKQSIQQLEDKLETIEKEKEYHPGDIVKLGENSVFPGHLTTNSTAIVFSVYLDKKIGNDVNEISISSTFTQVRHADGGYLIGNASATGSPCQNYFKAYPYKNSSVFLCVATGNYSATNNSVIDVTLGNFVVTFK